MSVPTFAPQLASLARTPPTGEQWLHEIKYDGYRIGCHLDAGDVRLLSRNGLDWTPRLPAIVDAVRSLRAREAFLDGEAAVVLPDGRTSFEALQRAVGDAPRRGSTSGPAEGRLVYFAFDLLQLDGATLEAVPLEERKARLRTLLGRRRASSLLHYADHVIGQGDLLFEQARALGLEGIVSKRRDRPYRPGRGQDWVKAKCLRYQTLVIGGFTDRASSTDMLGALLLGGYDAGGRLVYCGRVGTGFSHAVASDLRAHLHRLERRTPPFVPAPAGALGRAAHWVTPRLVANVAFTEWTGDGQLRHPSFQGLNSQVEAKTVALAARQPLDLTTNEQRTPTSVTSTAARKRTTRRSAR